LKISTLGDLLRWRSEEQPDLRAYTFLPDGEMEDGELTYGKLYQQARAIGARLQSVGAEGEFVLLLYPAGLEFIAAFFGCQLAGVVAIPAPLPKINRPSSRLQSIAGDVRVHAVLTTSALLPTIRKQLSQIQELQSVHWLATNNLAADVAVEWREPQLNSDALSFLQYTSGSTATPKGVMVSHGNLLSNSADLDSGWRHDERSVIVTWLPHFHDMGLIYGLLHPLYKQIPCYLMPPVFFLQRPIRWLEAIMRYRATHSAAPNFAYDLCVRKTTAEQRATLDLSHWAVAINGAEPVRRETLSAFTEAFAPSGFRSANFCPGYGLAEATLKVCASQRAKEPVFYHVEAAALELNREIAAPQNGPTTRTLVGCGRASPETQIAIVCPQTRERCEPGEVGEIWVSGPGVAQGYWNKPEETERTFGARLRGMGEVPFLRTGDLGFLRDRELFITGRIKDLIIIGGHNHYPHDLEQTAERSHPALRSGCCAAFTVETEEGEEHLVIAGEVERHYNPKQNQPEAETTCGCEPSSTDHKKIQMAVRRAIAEEHDLQVHAIILLKAGSISKTSSGKLQRHACRTAFIDGTLRTFGPSSKAKTQKSIL